MAFATLVSTDTLAELLGNPDLVVVDCRFKLDDQDWGEAAYLQGHIPGAIYAHLDRDLAGPKTGSNGRHPLPSAAGLGATLGRLGIAAGVQVVAYDQDSGIFASRLWWLLRWLDHRAVAVLDGGFVKWVRERRPTCAGRERRPARTFTGTPRGDLVADASEVASRVAAGEGGLIDARAPTRFRGEVEPLDKVAGHIPTAINHFYQENLDERGTFRSPDELRRTLQASVGDAPPERLICYCGSGVTACHNLLALEHAGLGGGKLYPGSWSEWSSDPSRPVVSGRAG